MNQSSNKIRIIALLSVFAVGVAIQIPANAADSASGEPVSALEEVVVTANKRSQNLQEVAMTATVLGAKELSEQKITTLADIASSVPGLNFSPTATNTPVLTLRGIGFNDGSISAYPTVSVYIDEVPLAFPVLSTQGAFDLQRIEVLKGPQGTLYGENSTGGAINYIAAKPTKQFESGADVGFGRFSTAEANGFISGPLSDTVSARLAVHYIHGDEWQYSYTRNDKLGKTDALAARAILDWSPTSALRFSLNLNGWSDKSDPQAGQLVAIFPQAPAFAQQALINYPYAPSDNRAADWTPNPYVNPIGQAINYRPRSTRHATQAMLRADYDLPSSVTLTSLTSYVKFSENQAEDFDGMALDDDDIYSNAGSISSFYQELRASNGAQVPFRWIAGTNFQSSHVDENDAISYADSVNNNPFLNNFFQNGYRSNTFRRDYAFFGNTEFDVNSQLTLQAGARYTKNLTRTTICNYDLGDGRVAGLVEGLGSFLTGTSITSLAPDGCVSLAFNNIPGPAFRDSLEQSNVSWRVGAQYKVDPNAMVYATVSKGFKAGSYPTISASSWHQLTPVTQESVVAYELGIKSSVLEKRFTFNAAAFYYNYRDKQISGQVLDPVFGLLGRLINVPKSNLYGGEFEAAWRPAAGFNLTASVTYIGSKVKEYFGQDTLGQTRDFSGSRIPFVSEWQGRLDGEYTWQLGSVQPFFGADVNARSDETTYIAGEFMTIPRSAINSTAPGTTHPFVIPGYATVDLRAGIGWDEGKWRAMVWGKNVLNKLYYNTSIYSFDTAYRLTGRPATYGISLFYSH